MNFLGFGQSAEIDIVFDGSENRKYADIKTEDGKKEKYLLYYDGETVSGKVNVTLKKPGSKLEHQGIKIEFIGQIELYYDRGNHHEFQSLVRELARPGDLIQNTSYPFNFDNVEKPYEIYNGSNVRLRYFLRVTVVRRISDIVKEIDIAVHTLCSYPEMNSPIKMEVGIEDCLHIEFEYNKSKYNLKDVIVGKIYFLLVRIKIKHMEIAIIKRETTGSGPNTFTENETIAKYEIMDGAPVRGESIPIRVFLGGYELTPTMREINKKFSVRYFLNLVLMDTEDRRYFKQQEITLWRKADKPRKPTSLSQSQQSNISGGEDDIKQSALQHHSDTHNNIQQQQQQANSSVSGVGHGFSTSSSTTSPTHYTSDPHMGLFIQENSQSDDLTPSSQNKPSSSSSPLEQNLDDSSPTTTTTTSSTEKVKEELPLPVENTPEKTSKTEDMSEPPPPLATTSERNIKKEMSKSPESAFAAAPAPPMKSFLDDEDEEVDDDFHREEPPALEDDVSPKSTSTKEPRASSNPPLMTPQSSEE